MPILATFWEKVPPELLSLMPPVRGLLAPTEMRPDWTAVVPLRRPGAKMSLLLFPRGWQVGFTSFATNVEVAKNHYGVAFAGGQGILKGKAMRIAHMGFCDKTDILVAVGALEMALARVGYPVQLGAGVRAAQEVFLGRS
jgi:hypothetical protein